MAITKSPRFLRGTGFGFLLLAVVALVVGFVAEGSTAAGQVGVATGFALVGGVLVVMGRGGRAPTDG